MSIPFSTLAAVTWRVAEPLHSFMHVGGARILVNEVLIDAYWPDDKAPNLHNELRERLSALREQGGEKGVHG